MWPSTSDGWVHHAMPCHAVDSPHRVTCVPTAQSSELSSLLKSSIAPKSVLCVFPSSFSFHATVLCPVQLLRQQSATSFFYRILTQAGTLTPCHPYLYRPYKCPGTTLPLHESTLLLTVSMSGLSGRLLSVSGEAERTHGAAEKISGGKPS